MDIFEGVDDPTRRVEYKDELERWFLESVDGVQKAAYLGGSDEERWGMLLGHAKQTVCFLEQHCKKGGNEEDELTYRSFVEAGNYGALFLLAEQIRDRQ